MGATGARLLRFCVPLLLRSGSQDLTCMVSSSDVDWTQTFNDPCLNFSGLGLSLPRIQALLASHLQVLDLSRNGLQALPSIFFAKLEKLQTLIVTHNRLVSVEPSLALRCELELRADCGCGLVSWHSIRQSNCSGEQELLCLHPDTGAPGNLSTFLQVSCPPSLVPGTIRALAAGTIFLALAVSGSVLAWRSLQHRGEEPVARVSAKPRVHLIPLDLCRFPTKVQQPATGPQDPGHATRRVLTGL